MPETAMNEDSRHSTRKDYIRPARQSGAVQPEPQPQSMKLAPQSNLGLRIGSPDPRHHAGSRRTIHNVGQSSSWRIAAKSLVSATMLSEDNIECHENSR